MAGFLDTLFGGGAERDAAERDRAALAQYQGQSLGALKDAYGQSTGYGREAVGAYDPLVALGQKYGGATNLQLDALGVNGPEGTARAKQAMMATPGYAAGIEGVMRRRAAAGMGDSGNTDQDLVNYATQSVYQPWLQGVTGAAQQGGQYLTNAAAGRAGGFTNLASLANQYGQQQTDVYGNVVSGTMDANKLEAAGAAAGAKNLLGAGLSLATAGAGSPIATVAQRLFPKA